PGASLSTLASITPASDAWHRGTIQPRGEVLRPVAEDEVGARALDRRQRLERRLPLVEPAAPRGRLHHRVLAGDVVGADRHVERLARGANHIEVRTRRVDHDGVGALLEVAIALAQRLAHA